MTPAVSIQTSRFDHFLGRVLLGLKLVKPLEFKPCPFLQMIEENGKTLSVGGQWPKQATPKSVNG